jgi:Ca2+-binding EF-hand superfamily protein
MKYGETLRIIKKRRMIVDETKQEIKRMRETYQRYLKNTDGELDYAEWLEHALAFERIRHADLIKDVEQAVNSNR